MLQLRGKGLVFGERVLLSGCECVCSVHADFAAPRTAARQAPLFVAFARQES